MYKCKVFLEYSESLLERELNKWFADMKDIPMYDVHFHYVIKKGEYSVLVTYRTEDEE